MPSISGVIPNVIGGISQQPPAARLENTAGDLKNAVASVVSGLRKRPPFQFNSTLLTGASFSTAVYFLERTRKPLKIITVDTSGNLKVIRPDGTQETVTASTEATSYLTSSDPMADIGFTQVADTIFVYNRTKVVGVENPEDTRVNPDTQITVVVEDTAMDITYKVEVSRLGVTQPGVFNESEGNLSSVNAVADVLVTSLNSFVGTPKLTASAENNTIVLGHSTGIVLDEWAVDTIAPVSMLRHYRSIIDRFTNLPPYETDGRLVRVQGDPEEIDASYWVEYNKQDKIWKETVGWDSHESLDPTTMPVTLKDNGDGTWTLDVHSWEPRLAGDENSNPSPSFVGSTINSMFLTANRMCFLSGENLIASKVGEFETFYRTTCTTFIPDDRIDVAALTAEGQVAIMNNAVEFDDGVLLFSDKSQFRLTTNEGLEPKTTNIRLTTSFNAARMCRPTRLGNNVAFIDDTDTGAWADMREYLINSVVGTNDSDIITKQVPELIPSGVTRIAANTTLGLAVITSRGNKNRLFVYSYYWADGQRIQSAWNYWEEPSCEFINIEFIGNILYAVAKRGDDLILLSTDMRETPNGDLSGIEVLLDMRLDSPDSVFDGLSSVVTLPYAPVAGERYFAVLKGGGGSTPGTAYEAEVDGSDLVFTGVDLSDATFLVGKPYEFIYELSPIFIRDQNKVPVQDARLQLRYLSILYHQASYFRVEVTPLGRDTHTSVFTGRTLGSPENIIGGVAVSDGEFRAPVSSEARTVQVRIINDSPFNSRFSSIEWEGSWRPKTTRITK